jgi:hypothetical protein
MNPIAEFNATRESTLRKKIAEALKGKSLDLREILQLFGIKGRDALDHLMHIERSVHPRSLE